MKEKKNKKKVIIIAVIVALIVGAGGFYGYTTVKANSELSKARDAALSHVSDVSADNYFAEDAEKVEKLISDYKASIESADPADFDGIKKTFDEGIKKFTTKKAKADEFIKKAKGLLDESYKDEVNKIVEKYKKQLADSTSLKDMTAVADKMNAEVKALAPEEAATEAGGGASYGGGAASASSGSYSGYSGGSYSGYSGASGGSSGGSQTVAPTPEPEPVITYTGTCYCGYSETATSPDYFTWAWHDAHPCRTVNEYGMNCGGYSVG